MTETLHCPNCGLGFTLMSDYLEHMRCYLPGARPYKRVCPGGDTTCPCQDGDMCHYEGPNAWPIPKRPD